MKTVSVQFDVEVPDDMPQDDAVEWIAFEVGANRSMEVRHPQMKCDLEPVRGSFRVR